ncbi:MAG TPA: MFS transporter [Casimicrobiaceae bacterium]|nr:MFS transporter [Casimicrobiaceae bacterium]
MNDAKPTPHPDPLPAGGEKEQPRTSSEHRPTLGRLVVALGIGQIISWGTLFYTIAVLGPPMARELRVSDVMLYGSFTAGLFLSGVASPWVGRRIDRHGGRGVLAGGSVLGALACALLATSVNGIMMLAGWLVAGVAMAACLYDPAFATLFRVSGASYRRMVTALTLFGGFASTVFWPLSQYLLEAQGWRFAFGVHAALNALVCLPLHLVFVPGASHRAVAQPTAGGGGDIVAKPDTFAWLATAFAIAAFLAGAVSAHLVVLLASGGLAARDAVLVGALIGPMQVAGRVMEFAFASRWSPLTVGMLAFTLLATALVVLCLVRGVWIVALAFALLYGWSNGVMTIVRGTVPGVLFGSRNYGTLLGRLAQPQFILKAFAPVAVTLLFTLDETRRLALYALALAALAALCAYRIAIRGRPSRMPRGDSRIP